MKKPTAELPEGYSAIDFQFARRALPEGSKEAVRFLADLLKSAREGHLCVSVEKFDRDLLPETLFDEMLVQEGDRIYLRRNWECEKRFLTHLNRLRTHPPTIPIELRGLDRDGLKAEQQAAVLKAANQSLTLISGGPGTGKTFTASVLVRLFLEAGLQQIFVGAPTGKATANIRSVLPPECRVETLHALLKQDQLYADLVLVDEGSMVDAELMAKLFSAIRSGTRLILLGDKDQLPPVESGHFFADLATDGELTAELKTCLRAELQTIVDLASSVKRGEKVPTKPLPEVKTLIQQILANPMTVLTPLRKGPYGADHLNRLLYLEHQKRGAKQIPIMITVNDPQLGLYNGDTGILLKDENRAIFRGKRYYPEYALPDYEYAYVMSVHKSQGSEYDKVMVLLPEGAECFGREMLYTAVTRAKREITLLAHPHVLEKIVNSRSERYSGVISNTPLR